MTEMDTPVEVVSGNADALIDSLVGFTGCVATAVPDICSYGLTIGDDYVPFAPDPDDDCDDEETMCSQLWVRVTSVTPDATQSWSGDCAVTLRINLEVGVVRCIEVPEGGEAPTATDVLAAAVQSMTDMNAIFCTAMACEAVETIESGQWTPFGPQGGQYGGTWTFTVEV